MRASQDKKVGRTTAIITNIRKSKTKDEFN